MPDWQSELDALLAELHVSLDIDPDVLGRGTAITYSVEALDLDDLPSGDLPWELGALTAEEPPTEDDEVSAVRSEIEATVGRVIEMARDGRLDTDVRDDVVFVLRALTRPHPSRAARRGTSQRAQEAQREWQLASAAAVLRFCRIALRLAQALAPESESEN